MNDPGEAWDKERAKLMARNQAAKNCVTIIGDGGSVHALLNAARQIYKTVPAEGNIYRDDDDTRFEYGE